MRCIIGYNDAELVDDTLEFSETNGTTINSLFYRFHVNS